MNPTATDIFNAAVNAAAIAALDEVGLLTEMKERGSVDVPAFCEKAELHGMSVGALVRGLSTAGIVEVGADGRVARPGPGFEEVYRNKGYFLWLVRGYGNMLRSLSTLIQLPERRGSFVDRDAVAIAKAGKDYGPRFVDADFKEVLDREPYKVVADLGCGSGGRLVGYARERADFHAVGVEMRPDTVVFARQQVAEAGFGDRVQIILGDVRNLEPRPEFENVDVVFSFFMGHDLWPRENCILTLDQLGIAFPSASRFLLCDTYRSDLPGAQPPPIFTLGYEVTHAVMGQYIPSQQEWLDLFEETTWRCVGSHAVGIPYSAVFDLRRRAR